VRAGLIDAHAAPLRRDCDTSPARAGGAIGEHVSLALSPKGEGECDLAQPRPSAATSGHNPESHALLSLDSWSFRAPLSSLHGRSFCLTKPGDQAHPWAGAVPAGSGTRTSRARVHWIGGAGLRGAVARNVRLPPRCRASSSSNPSCASSSFVHLAYGLTNTHAMRVAWKRPCGGTRKCASWPGARRGAQMEPRSCNVSGLGVIQAYTRIHRPTSSGPAPSPATMTGRSETSWCSYARCME
jgi:hypothetical protein